LGRHSKPSRIKLPQGAQAAAAPTLAGVVAAFFLSQQLPIASAEAAVLPSHSANPDTVGQRGDGGLSASGTRSAAITLSAPQLISATREELADIRSAFQAASQEKPSTSLPAWYKVQPGDSLSAIAQRFYNNAAAWPVLYWGNHNQIQWADDIQVGQMLRIPAEPTHIPNPPAQLEPAPVVTTASYTPQHASSAPVQAQSSGAQTAPVQQADTSSDLFGSLGVIPGGAFGQCVVERESGGNPQVMNSTGHYGLFQFSYSTWVAYGGNPADFGHASVAEQEQVFANALASPGGENNWAPYDGC
jgi:LysM repeat protein